MLIILVCLLVLLPAVCLPMALDLFVSPSEMADMGLQLDHTHA